MFWSLSDDKRTFKIATPKLTDMKAILITWLLMAPLFSLCQNDTTKSKSKIETDAIKIGTIIKKQTNHIYDYQAKYYLFNFKPAYGTGNFSCDMLTIKDVNSGVVTKGLYLSTCTYTSATYTGYIDAVEVTGLIKFLDFLEANQKYREPEGTEYIYTCNDVRFSCFNTKDNHNNLAWLYKINVNTRFENAVAYFDINELNNFNQKLKENLEKLN